MMGSDIHEPDGRDLDGLLDRALTSYTPAQSRAGLEQRVMARIDAEPDRRGSGWGWGHWAWTTGCAVAALLVCWGGIHLHPLRVRGPQPTVLTQPSSSASVRPFEDARDAPGTSSRTPPNRESKAALRPRHSPALEAGPSQQQLIAQLLKNAPQTVATLVRSPEELNRPIDVEPLRNDPVVVEPIKVAPIRIAQIGNGQTENKPMDDSSAPDGGRL